MKGYLNGNGYMGLVNGRYILFTSEAEYECEWPLYFVHERGRVRGIYGRGGLSRCLRW